MSEDYFEVEYRKYENISASASNILRDITDSNFKMHGMFLIIAIMSITFMGIISEYVDCTNMIISSALVSIAGLVLIFILLNLKDSRIKILVNILVEQAKELESINNRLIKDKEKIKEKEKENSTKENSTKEFNMMKEKLIIILLNVVLNEDNIDISKSILTTWMKELTLALERNYDESSIYYDILNDIYNCVSTEGDEKLNDKIYSPTEYTTYILFNTQIYNSLLGEINSRYLTIID